MQYINKVKIMRTFCFLICYSSNLKYSEIISTSIKFFTYFYVFYLTEGQLSNNVEKGSKSMYKGKSNFLLNLWEEYLWKTYLWIRSLFNEVSKLSLSTIAYRKCNQECNFLSWNCLKIFIKLTFTEMNYL